ncbi:hypothetical protein [Streptomyces sp. SHP 1-2]|uniref:hypothetical protein n=1 Tax=Streptomyces sp. SHP 1-2 TaxID=2769489 RepID=UPI0022385296|nr:hypothetical protein [Streptomyces sp. SHP 1-2]MCW5250340.1 hypothetical protein [Streptomyces sp. SHP 1-2]
MTSITISGELDHGLLREWLRDPAGGPGAGASVAVTGVRGRGPAGTAVLFEGTGPDLALTVPDPPPCDPTWWTAATVRRRLRRVPDTAACASPGLESVLRTGDWRHPDATGERPGADGVLLFKPGMEVTAAALRELGDRLAECGYRAERARMLPGREITDLGAAAAHYRPHTELARRGVLTAEERIALLRVYDRPGFRARFGARPQDLDVVPAYRLLAEERVTAEELEKWSTASAELRGLDSGAVDGPNEIGDCLFVNVFQESASSGGEAVIVVNPHMPGVLAQLERPGNSAVAVLVSAAGGRPLPWKRMRREFCGATDPARALPGSLRGDALAGLFPLRGTTGEPVRRTNNGVHLSNGVVEAMHDTLTWFGIAPERTAPGRRLARAGTDPAAVLTRPFLEVSGRRRAVATLTDGLDAEDAARALATGRRCEADDFPGATESARRVDLAWDLAQPLGHAPGALAVLVTGSVGRGRACPDSDLNLLVVHDAGPRAGTPGRPLSECRVVDGVRVLVEYVPLDEAMSLTSGPHPSPTGAPPFPAVLRRLGLAARFTGLPLLDDRGHARRLAERAGRQSVPSALLAERLDEVLRLVSGPHGGRPDRAAVRSAAYELAVTALAARPPRFHKPKWVPSDLRTIGRPDLWAVLSEAWQVGRPSRAEVSAALRVSAASSATDLGALADARALLAAGLPSDALFCARFAARAGLPHGDPSGSADASLPALAERLAHLAEQERRRSAA